MNACGLIARGKPLPSQNRLQYFFLCASHRLRIFLLFQQETTKFRGTESDSDKYPCNTYGSGQEIVNICSNTNFHLLDLSKDLEKASSFFFQTEGNSFQNVPVHFFLSYLPQLSVFDSSKINQVPFFFLESG